MNKYLQRAARRWRTWVAPSFMVGALSGVPLQAAAYDVTMNPLTQTVLQGTQVSVAVTVADVLPGGVGNFNFDIGFDSAILDFSSAVDGAALGFSFGLDVVDNGNSVTLSDFSLELPDDLLALQAPSLTLFTLVFDTVGLGTSDLVFGASSVLGDAAGVTQVFGATGASVTVEQRGGGGGGNDVPEPATLALSAAGLLAGAAVRRRTRRAH